ncbi:MAG: hypothetical protein K2G43_03640 [Bacteroides sp.]|nr:hypothetical protein [Bacteroides sp.]
MIVALYTSRKILEALGVEDFGIFNVVGGIISLMAFINGSMSVATQRYLTYELGKGTEGQFNKVFNIAVYIHAIIAVIVLIMAETVGVWFVNTQLNIPEVRMGAANWVYQATILTTILGMLQTPYNAAIVSHEHMHVYAYVGLGETFTKLFIVLGLFYYPYDRLAVWGFVFFFIQLCSSLIYRLYCIRKFDNCTLKRNTWDSQLVKSMLGFTGWNMFGTVAWTLKDQGASVLLNIFGGPAVNAARGVSGQVTGAVKGLVGGFQSAVNPQLTKTYAANDSAATCRLLCKSSKFSYFLLLLISIPVLLDINFLLDVWLVEVPQYAALFTRIVIVEALFDTLGGPMITSLMATGRIKWYQIIVGSILLLNIPVAYLLLKLGYPIVTPLIVSLLFIILGNAVRLLFCRSMLGLSICTYIRTVLIPIMIVSVLAFIVPYIIFSIMTEGWWRLLACSIFSVFFGVVSIYHCGFTDSERIFIVNMLRNKLLRFIPCWL